MSLVPTIECRLFTARSEHAARKRSFCVPIAAVMKPP